MTENVLIYLISIPLISGILTLATGKKFRIARDLILLSATAVNLVLSAKLFGKEISNIFPWAGFGMEFSLRAYHFSEFIILAGACFAFLIALYSTAFMRGKDIQKQFYSYFLIAVAFINGAVLSDNIVLFLFFWEGLLLTMFGMIAIGNKDAFKTATKAFVIIGLSDLCMMVGIGLAGHISGTWSISSMNIPLTALGGLAFVLLMIGAIAKSGSMPFHSWIPDAAKDAPLPFMAFFPAALEKLIGIYFLTRISLDMFKLEPHTWASTLMMIIGAATILLAVMMALIQKEYKRLLSYHAISQVGYMILGIGTCLPIGIIGGLFHMVNNALYKSCLFFTGGAVEKEVRTTYLEKLGGLGKRMPVTLACFLITALSISGVPPFNGFFSKEMIYDAALERGAVYYIAALLGSFFTAASFLKLGHAAFFGKLNNDNKNVKEAPWQMLLPMILLALTCVFFGVKYSFPINNFIMPVFGSGAVTHAFAVNHTLALITVIVLVGAVLNHLYGAKIMGSGLKAADHIRNAPLLRPIYDRAEKKYFDPYDIGLAGIGGLSKFIWLIDRGINWVYDGAAVSLSYAFSRSIRRAHTGSYPLYIGWSLVGSAIVILFVMFWSH